MNRRVKDITGVRFGRLVALEFFDIVPGGARWTCVCDCGNTKVVPSSSMVRGDSRSCGCLNLERIAEMGRGHARHGESRRTSPKTTEWKLWQSMIRRCHTPGASGYSKYGAKGIQVCDRWRNSYEDFLTDVGRRPSNDHSIDRIDPRGNYEPGNVRWLENKYQARNRTSCVLNEQLVAEIKTALQTPYHGIGADLSRKYGVGSHVISSIRTGRSWSDVERKSA